MKKHFITTLLFLTTTLTLSAANEAEALIKKAAEAFSKKGTEITFTIDMDGDEVKGKLLMDGKKYHIEADDMSTWFDGKTQWLLQSSDSYSEVYISEPTDEELMGTNPYMLLNNYGKMFNASLGAKKNGIQEIVLSAKDANDIQSVSVWIKSDGSLGAMTIATPQGMADIKVTAIRSCLSLSKDSFVIPKSSLKAAEVIDMR